MFFWGAMYLLIQTKKTPQTWKDKGETWSFYELCFDICS